MNDPFTLYKLIILYILSKTNFPLSKTQLSEFLIEHEYTNYFTAQEAIADNLESNFIYKESTTQHTLYHLTETGHETVNFFSSDISQEIRSEIDSFIKEKYHTFISEFASQSRYYKNNDNEYIVSLVVKEKKGELLNLSLSVPDEKTAENIANNWGQKNQEVYALIMEHLL